MTNNDITGDAIHTRPNSKEYRDNWDKIFGKNPDTITKDEFDKKKRSKGSGKPMRTFEEQLDES